MYLTKINYGKITRTGNGNHGNIFFNIYFLMVIQEIGWGRQPWVVLEVGHVEEAKDWGRCLWMVFEVWVM